MKIHWSSKRAKMRKRSICTQYDYRLPIKGLSEVIGIISETVLRKIVRESRIVTPEMMLEWDNSGHVPLPTIHSVTLTSNELGRQTGILLCLNTGLASLWWDLIKEDEGFKILTKVIEVFWVGSLQWMFLKVYLIETITTEGFSRFLGPNTLKLCFLKVF